MVRLSIAACLAIFPLSSAIAQDAISQDAANNAVIMSADQDVRD